MSAPEPASVPLLDVGRHNRPLDDKIQEAIRRVCESGRFLHGPDVGELENSVAEFCGVKHAIACASGSDAILLSLMATDIGPGDEVIVPSFTFFATASAVWRLGATPVFADIDPDTFNVDPASVQKAVTTATKAILPVHLFGQCARMEEFNALGRASSIRIIEDAAQAIGARRGASAAGSMGAIGCFSFYPTKNLGAFGDGGMLTTNDEQIAKRLRLLASHGMTPRYYHKVVGINSRLDSIQAAILNIKLRELATWTQQRRDNAQKYLELLDDATRPEIVLPVVESDSDHCWNQFTIRVRGGSRDGLRSYLAERGVSSEVYYPVALHLQECFRELGYELGSLPKTEQAAAEALSLPIFPGLRDNEQVKVVRCIRDFFNVQTKSAA